MYSSHPYLSECGINQSKERKYVYLPVHDVCKATNQALPKVNNHNNSESCHLGINWTACQTEALLSRLNCGSFMEVTLERACSVSRFLYCCMTLALTRATADGTTLVTFFVHWPRGRRAWSADWYCCLVSSSVFNKKYKSNSMSITPTTASRRILWLYVQLRLSQAESSRQWKSESQSSRHHSVCMCVGGYLDERETELKEEEGPHNNAFSFKARYQYHDNGVYLHVTRDEGAMHREGVCSFTVVCTRTMLLSAAKQWARTRRPLLMRSGFAGKLLRFPPKTHHHFCWIW